MHSLRATSHEPTMQLNCFNNLIGCCLAATLLRLGALGAQVESPLTDSVEPTFIETTDVRVVDVDVYVTTRDGEPVTDLTADDFEVYEDGKPVAVTNFYKVIDGVPVTESVETPAGAATAPEEESEPVTGRPALPTRQPQVPESQRLSLIIYLDSHNMSSIHRTRVLGQLNEFIAGNVRDGARGMLVTYDQTLNVRQPFTDNSATLLRAIEDLELTAGRPTTFERERADIMREIEDADSLGSLAGQVSQFSRSVQNDLRFTLEAMTDMVRSLAGLPGRKALLYVSDGLAMSPGKDLVYMLRNKFTDAPLIGNTVEFDMTRRLRQIEQQANSNRVSFYTLDATGLQMPSGFSAEHRGGVSGNDLRSSVDAVHQNNYQDSIRRVALRTGGVPILNTNNAAPALRKISKSLWSYYSLGYDPRGEPDERYHRIEVKVNRPGVDVRYREGYRHKNAHTLVGESLEAGMRYGLQSNPLAVMVQVGQVEPYDDEYLLLPLTIRIPIGNLALVPQGALHRAQVSLYFSALSDEGEEATVSRDTVSVEVPEEELETARAQVYRYDTKLQIKPGPQRIGVAVRDVLAAKVSQVIVPVR